MPAFKSRVQVYLEGKEDSLVFEYDQRDIARAEALEVRGANTNVRAIAWAAMVRQKLYRETWERFNTVDCVETCDPDDAEPEPEGEQGLDPGR